jgi:hypothetical protein
MSIGLKMNSIVQISERFSLCFAKVRMNFFVVSFEIVKNQKQKNPSGMTYTTRVNAKFNYVSCKLTGNFREI